MCQWGFGSGRAQDRTEPAWPCSPPHFRFREGTATSRLYDCRKHAKNGVILSHFPSLGSSPPPLREGAGPGGASTPNSLYSLHHRNGATELSACGCSPCQVNTFFLWGRGGLADCAGIDRQASADFFWPGVLRAATQGLKEMRYGSLDCVLRASLHCLDLWQPRVDGMGNGFPVGPMGACKGGGLRNL